MAEIEVFPGFSLDFMEINGAVFEQKVLPCLAEISDLKEQIYFLERLLIQHEREVGNNAQGYEERRRRSQLARAFDDEMYDQIDNRGKYLIRAKEFEDRCKRHLLSANKLLELETRTDESEKEDEDTPDLSNWDNSTRGLALYALLRFAKLPKGFNQTKVAKFARLMTGRSQKKMEIAIRNADGASFTPEDMEAVANQFGHIGLWELAAEVRQKFYKIGTGYRTRSKSRS